MAANFINSPGFTPTSFGSFPQLPEFRFGGGSSGASGSIAGSGDETFADAVAPASSLGATPASSSPDSFQSVIDFGTGPTRFNFDAESGTLDFGEDTFDSFDPGEFGFDFSSFDDALGSFSSAIDSISTAVGDLDLSSFSSISDLAAAIGNTEIGNTNVSTLSTAFSAFTNALAPTPLGLLGIFASIIANEDEPSPTPDPTGRGFSGQSDDTGPSDSPGAVGGSGIGQSDDTGPDTDPGAVGGGPGGSAADDTSDDGEGGDGGGGAGGGGGGGGEGDDGDAI